MFDNVQIKTPHYLIEMPLSVWRVTVPLSIIHGELLTCKHAV